MCYNQAEYWLKNIKAKPFELIILEEQNFYLYITKTCHCFKNIYYQQGFKEGFTLTTQRASTLWELYDSTQ